MGHKLPARLTGPARRRWRGRDSRHDADAQEANDVGVPQRSHHPSLLRQPRRGKQCRVS